MHPKNIHPPRQSYRESNSKEDTEPSGGKRDEDGDEKPIGRIGKRGEERELILPVHRKGNAGRKAAVSRHAKPNRGSGTVDRIGLSDAATRENGTGSWEIGNEGTAYRNWTGGEAWEAKSRLS